MGQGLWGSAQAGLGVGMEFARSQAQLEYERGFNERKMALEEEAARLQQERQGWEKERFDYEKTQVALREKAIKDLIGSVKPTGANLTKAKNAGEKVKNPYEFLTKQQQANEAAITLDPEGFVKRLLPPTSAEQTDIDYKKQLIDQSKAITDNYRATAQKSVKAYGFTVEDAAKVLEGYNKYVNDFEKTTQNNIYSLISDKGFDPTTYRPPEPMSLEEYIESVKDVEAGLTGKKTLVGVDKGPPTIAPEDEEFFR